MLIYIRCPTCGVVIAKNFHLYSAELDNIRNDFTTSSQQKRDLHVKLLEKYEYKNLCCRMRILGTIEAHKIVVT